MDGNAIILTHGLLNLDFAKVAHGLIRGTERYNILAIIDHKFAGLEIRDLLGGDFASIPIYDSIGAAISMVGEKIDYLIIGLAFTGGKIPKDVLPIIKSAIISGMSVVNGSHQFLSAIPEIADLAKEHDVALIDVRKPKPKSELHTWTGRIRQVKTPKIAILGTDSAIGKRTTCSLLTDSARNMGLRAEMIYTGQTGWMLGNKYGFILDATVNDFIAGELEHALVSCARETDPQLIFMEGQSALRNPMGVCGSEFLTSGQANGVILQHKPSREYYHDTEEMPVMIPSLQSEVALIKMYGVETLAITLNGDGLSKAQATRYKEEYAEELGIPVFFPFQDGVDKLLEMLCDKYRLKIEKEFV
ncbi:MAG: DUF1611 domain-containing protein [Cytophagales bacterium]|nr:MAG: DUF1611 domain-containing protein [Cytophagales bacterium]